MKNVYAVLLFLFLYACKNSAGKDDLSVKTLTVTRETVTEKINSADYFTSITCIPLETNAETLIDNIVKVVHRGKFIYVADRFALYRFHEDGTLDRKIQKTGSGPGEYAGISDFEAATEETVWILSRNNRKLYLFTWDGELKKSVELDCRASKMYMISPEKICLYAGNEREATNHHQFKIIDVNTNEIISNQLEIDPEKAKYLHVHSPCHFSSNEKGEIYVFNIFDDAVYEIMHDKFVPVFKTDLFGRNIPASFYNDAYTDVSYFFQALLKGNYAWGTVLFAEYKDVYLHSCYYEGTNHMSFISKETNKSLTSFKSISENVLLSGYPVDLTETTVFLQQKSSEWIIPLIPSEIMEYAKEHPETFKKVKETIKYSSEDQNPVLLFLKRQFSRYL
jgi:hypothetical protein